ncbi:hypothetical protein BDQ17DRAFT_1326679 [Cyathus striatus]|nr:hypothetical protein BDQ17DRAFT_1326679 [Cyathus striatus]
MYVDELLKLNISVLSECKRNKISTSFSIQKAGSSEAGEFAFVEVWDAGHFIVGDRSELVKNIMLRWIHSTTVFTATFGSSIHSSPLLNKMLMQEVPDPAIADVHDVSE